MRDGGVGGGDEGLVGVGRVVDPAVDAAAHVFGEAGVDVAVYDVEAAGGVYGY